MARSTRVASIPRDLRPMQARLVGKLPTGPGWQVAEVCYSHVTPDRFRHGKKFLRWRPDKAPTQCTFEQLQREAQPARLTGKLLTRKK